MQLNDMTLFRQQALIDGQWRDAPNGDVIAVTNPANGEQARQRAENGRR